MASSHWLQFSVLGSAIESASKHTIGPTLIQFFFSNLRIKRLRLHNFGPLWAISTGNQWEISEVGRLSCLIDFFVLFHIVCDRYTSDFAHFIFSDTI